MGDSGSMLVGLMLSAAAVTATGGVDPQSFDSAASLLPLTLPLLVPIAVLFIPFIDLVHGGRPAHPPGQSPFSPDKMHLHHRLLSIGHSHRRAVLVMYFWAALLSFGAVALSITGGTAELLVAIAVAAGRRRGRRAQPAGPPGRARGPRGGAGRAARSAAAPTTPPRGRVRGRRPAEAPRRSGAGRRGAGRRREVLR